MILKIKRNGMVERHGVIVIAFQKVDGVIGKIVDLCCKPVPLLTTGEFYQRNVLPLRIEKGLYR